MSFSGDIKKFTDKAERRYRAVYRMSSEQVADLANLSTGKGGRMRVDLGFLRASQAAELNKLPVGPSENTEGRRYGSRIGKSVTEALASWDIGDTLFVGWTANYARPREYRDGFVRGAVEQWPQIVRQNVAKAKAGGL